MRGVGEIPKDAEVVPGAAEVTVVDVPSGAAVVEVDPGVAVVEVEPAATNNTIHQNISLQLLNKFHELHK